MYVKSPILFFFFLLLLLNCLRLFCSGSKLSFLSFFSAFPDWLPWELSHWYSVDNLVSPISVTLKTFLTFFFLLPYSDIPFHSPFTLILVYLHLMPLQISTIFAPADWKRYFRATWESEKALRGAGGFRRIWKESWIQSIPQKWRNSVGTGGKVCLCM